MQLVAKPSLCSCAVFTNRTNQAVYLESGIGDVNTGDAVVPPQQSFSQRFDWAGAKPTDFYIIRAWTDKGSPMRFGTDVTFTITPWEDCAQASCPFEPMMLNVGQSGHNPGDR